MSLKQRLIEQIALEGPMTVADYMSRCLLDPLDGYYTRNVAIGADGDFITAPMISQIFGEMIGVWVAEVWQSLGAPSCFHLVEIGGGDGTLMSDVRRVAARVPGLSEAAKTIMIEPSPVLRTLQTQRLGDLAHLNDIAALPVDAPVIAFANEVLDCLPSRQFVKSHDGWRERLVGARNDELALGLAAETCNLDLGNTYHEGDIVEVSTAQAHFIAQICQLLRETTGAALLIDYGRDDYEAGDTLQALHRHRRFGPLESPGEHDLTVWANFQSVTDIARKTHVNCSLISTQSSFLERMGSAQRFEALCAARPDKIDKLTRQYDRLMSPDGMGQLFKVAGLSFPADVALPGLELLKQGAPGDVFPLYQGSV